MGQYFQNVEDRFTFLEEALTRLQPAIKETESTTPEKPENEPETPKVIVGIIRRGWTNFNGPKTLKPKSILSKRSLQSEPSEQVLHPQATEDHDTSLAANKKKDEVEDVTRNYVLEVLIGETRLNPRRHSEAFPVQEISGTEPDRINCSPPINKSKQKSASQPQRLRIRSEPILGILKRISGLPATFYASEPLVILRPFKLLITYEDKIRKELKSLKDKWCIPDRAVKSGQDGTSANWAMLSRSGDKTLFAEAAGNQPVPGEGGPLALGTLNENVNSVATSEDPENEIEELDVTETREALDHLQLLVDFLDIDLHASLELRRQIASGVRLTIAFADLWREILKFDKAHYKELKDDGIGSWNGRQIRNAFQTAIALAEFKANDKGYTPELTALEFQDVAKASKEFDSYIKITLGGGEADLARTNRVRIDDYKAGGETSKVAERSKTSNRQLQQRTKKKAETDSEDSESENSSSESGQSEENVTEEEEAPMSKSKKSKEKMKTKKSKH